MAPSHKAMVRQSHISKHYNLRSSPLKLNPSLLSSEPSPCINNDSGLLRIELTIAHEAVSKIGTFLGTDINQLRKELAKTEREKEKAFTERDNIVAAHQNFLHSADVVLQCPICQAVIKQPFILACHHTFCCHCLLSSFHDRIRACLSCCINETLPERFQHHLAPFTSAEVKELCDGPYTIIPGCFYTCPTCQAYVEKPLVEIPLLSEVVGRITEVLGPNIERSERRVPAIPAAHWGVFFKQ
ncbi:uncharacterized protein F5147DRAFT_778972 [Suillus discolor]|uniref:RING-type domain-containing protein n=1 Tax=Suillus discolor TaxID=1912936 RepID=A0A9P7EWV7_9AGAM|nr:uncharacterized protein F5147DRAFT_778972 [Suillus discolor]KAG2094665.1 hypothetical protein F5147DRAFT_778972 [Suillus discolor]